MKNDTKNTCEIDIIDMNGNSIKAMIPSLEYFKKQLYGISNIPFSFFTNKNDRRKTKINKLLSKWD